MPLKEKSPPYRLKSSLKALSVSLLLATISCNSADYSFYSKVYPPSLLLVQVNCSEQDSSAVLEPGIRIGIRAGKLAQGIPLLRYLLLGLCLREKEELSSLSEEQGELTVCSDLDLSDNFTGISDSCPELKLLCLPSLQLPVNCADYKNERNSKCYLSSGEKLSWRGKEELPLISLSEGPYRPRSSKWWLRICCEYSSQACRSNGDCERGICKQHCLKTGKVCSEDSDCQEEAEDRCIGFCSTNALSCGEDRDCAPGEKCIAKRCREGLKVIPLVSKLEDQENFFAEDIENNSLRLLCFEKEGTEWQRASCGNCPR